MKELRKYLGRHRNHRPGQLTERETAMLIICAGRKAGFTVKTEISVRCLNKKKNEVRGEMDVAWYNEDCLVAVWEIDGQDAGEGHFLGYQNRAGNIAKFSAANAICKIQVLYSLKNNLEIKRRTRFGQICESLNDIALLVTDEALMEPNGIESITKDIVDEARLKIPSLDLKS